MTKPSFRFPAILLVFFLAAPVIVFGGFRPPFASAGPARSGDRVQVLVLGTIHQRHSIDPNYSYADIDRILAGYRPDLVCVEIRPQDFRKVAYLKEMMLATIWGVARKVPVAPIDWWDDTQDVRGERDKLAKQPEYIEKEKREKELYAASPIVSRFEAKYGPADDEIKWSKDLGYAFWNGPDYNEFYAEVYRISMEVYGDSPFNLFYQTRNSRMMDLITRAIGEHKSRRVIVLTGSEHKHFFDRELKQDAGIEVLDLAGLLPLDTAAPLEPAVANFLDEDEDAPYYAPGYPADPDAAFQMKLTPLLHGPDMDVFPDKVPPANIARAVKILDRWASARPGSDSLLHEQGWVHLLRGEYPSAVEKYSSLARKIDAGQVNDPWLRFDTYLNLGRAHDLLGDRAKALAAYARSRELTKGTRWESFQDYIFKDYDKVPFKRSKAGEPRGKDPK